MSLDEMPLIQNDNEYNGSIPNIELGQVESNQKPLRITRRDQDAFFRTEKMRFDLVKTSLRDMAGHVASHLSCEILNSSGHDLGHFSRLSRDNDVGQDSRMSRATEGTVICDFLNATGQNLGDETFKKMSGDMS